VSTIKTANKLAEKSIKAPNAFEKLPMASSIQTVAKGNNMATERATQTTLLFPSFSYLIPKTATIEAKTAIKKSIIFGFTLLKISSVSILKPVSFVTINQMKIAKNIEVIKIFKEFERALFAHLAIP
jgi:hypothetical protein